MNNRKTKSKTLIKNCFSTMIQESHINKITVASLCSRCNINRSTFYFYYSDIYALFEEYKSEKLSVFEKKLSDIISVHFSSEKQIMNEILLFITENKQDLRTLLQNDTNNDFMRSLDNTIQSAFRHAFYQRYDTPEDITKNDLNILIDFFSNGFYSMYYRLIMDSSQSTTDDLLKITELLTDLLDCRLIRKSLS